MILLTDGHTYGDEEKCIAAARKAGMDQIGISALGIGEDWNTEFLEELVRHAEGTCTYISHPRHVRQVLQKQIRGLSNLVARDMQLRLNFTDKASLGNAFTCFPEANRLKPEDSVLNLGLLNRNSWVQLLVEVIVAPELEGEHRLLDLELSGMVPALGKRETASFSLTGKFVEQPGEGQIPTAIINALSRISLYRMQEQAWAALDEGDPVEASNKLKAVATRLLDLGENDLARMAIVEASRVSEGKQVTGKGRKTITYGTRALGIES